MRWQWDLFGRDPTPIYETSRSTSGANRPARQLDLLGTPCLTIPGSGDAVASSIQYPSWIEGVCKAMSTHTDGLPTAEDVGRRWSAALARRFAADGRAKRIARALSCDVRTAEAWIAGQAPYLHVAIAAAIRLRDPLLLYELAGIAPPAAEVEARELDTLRADLDALGARIDRLREGAA